MAIPITIPRLGWSMEVGTFQGWLKQNGELVRAGEFLFRLESDKATQEIECLDDGILQIAADAPKEGDTVAVGAVIGHLQVNAEAVINAKLTPPSVQTNPRRTAMWDGSPEPSAASDGSGEPSHDIAPCKSPRSGSLAARTSIGAGQRH